MDSLLWRLTCVTVPGRRGPRLDRVSVEISAGITAVMGPSGAGKTTLLNLLVGFERPGTGRVDRLFSPKDRLSVFWSPPGHGLWPQLTVREHLASLCCEPEPARPASTDRLLGEYELTALARAYPATLSQGERDRLSLARALASGAQVLVLDEPLIHVGCEAAARYWAQTLQHCQCTGTSLIVATHDEELARRDASRILRLESGRVSP